MSKQPAQLSDEALARKAAADPEAEAALLERYKEEVRRLGRTFYILGADREDVVQEGMIGLFRAIRTYDPEGGASFRTYASVCINRQIMDAAKRASGKKHAPLNYFVPLEEEGEERLSALLAEGRDEEDGRAAGLEELVAGPWRSAFSELEYQVISRYLAGESYETMAKDLKKEPKSVYNAMGRIKLKIRRLAERGG